MALYIGLGMLVLGALGIALGFFFRSQAGKILAAPFRKTAEVAGDPRAADASGMASCEGAVRTQQPLTAPCSGQPCVHYHLKVEKQVKESQGGQTRTSWKLVADHHVGSSFWLDDGSGPVAIHTQQRVDADLRQTFAGPPPGGPGLGVLAGVVTPAPDHGRGEVLGYKVTERIIGLDAPLFAMGQVHGGQLAAPASGKLVVSTRGRDGLVGAKKRIAAIAMAVGGLVAAAGVPIVILRPGEAKACGGSLQDTVAECAIESKEVTIDETQPDASTKPVTLQQKVLAWKVTKAGTYELFARQAAKKGKTYPRIQVENELGFPVNIGINWGLSSESAQSTQTKTASLEPGTYKIYVWSDKGGPSTLLFKIAEAKNATASK